MVAFLTFILASVLNAATSASLRNNTNPIPTAKPQSSCSTICEAFGAPDGCSLEMKTRGMSEELSKVMLDKHNQLRRKLAKGEQENQPSAANMKKLVWSEKLASSAQEKVDECGSSANLTFPEATFTKTWTLSHCDSNTTTTMEDFENIVQDWYNATIIAFGNSTDQPVGESQPESWPAIQTQISSVAGNAPFLGETKALGCGLLIYAREAWQNLKLFCYYDGPFQLLSDPLYEVGPSCSSCQPGFSCDDGLCASNNPQVTTTERGSTVNVSTEGESTDVSGTGNLLGAQN